MQLDDDLGIDVEQEGGGCLNLEVTNVQCVATGDHEAIGVGDLNGHDVAGLPGDVAQGDRSAELIGRCISRMDGARQFDLDGGISPGVNPAVNFGVIERIARLE